MIINVTEIVSSLQGEGKYTGYPTTFVRLHGCNLKCSYCDTSYSCSDKSKKKRMSVDSILSAIFRLGNRRVCITGGEPLLQSPIYCLIYDLVSRNYIVSIETNGSVAIGEVGYRRSYSYCMDVKCPSSGMEHRNLLENLNNLTSDDEVKFVVSDYNDYQYAKKVLKKYPTKAGIIFSPCFIDGKSNAKELSQWILKDRLNNARLGVQVHRLIGIY